MIDRSRTVKWRGGSKVLTSVVSGLNWREANLALASWTQFCNQVQTIYFSYPRPVTVCAFHVWKGSWGLAGGGDAEFCWSLWAHPVDIAISPSIWTASHLQSKLAGKFSLQHNYMHPVCDYMQPVGEVVFDAVVCTCSGAMGSLVRSGSIKRFWGAIII